MSLDTSNQRSFTRHLMTAEMLDADTEYELACAWRDKGDEAALHRLITAYMRLAVSTAQKFRRYGAARSDLVQEASIGLMKAAQKFDPDRGVRFSTYAIWWIRAALQEYVQRNWSMVRTGSTSAQKALFFNLKRVQAELLREASKRGEVLDQHRLNTLIAARIGVPLRDVEIMSARLSGGDLSLNVTPAGGDDGREWIDLLRDESAPTAERVAERFDRRVLRRWLTRALMGLSKRERFILRERKLRPRPRTLASLGAELGLSKERVRQVERSALNKMRDLLSARAIDVHQFLS